MKSKLRKLLRFLGNPRLLLCFGIAWIITNGWSYILLGIGTYYEVAWMVAVAGAYLTFLWLPISPEKIVTALIAMGLLRWIFPRDEKTLGVLRELYGKYRSRHKEKRKKNEKNP